MASTPDDPMVIDDDEKSVPGNSQLGWKQSWGFGNIEAKDQKKISTLSASCIDLTDCEQDYETETVSRNTIRRLTSVGDFELITGRPIEQSEIDGIIRLQRLGTHRPNVIQIDDEEDESEYDQFAATPRPQPADRQPSRQPRLPTSEDLIIDLEEEEGVLYDELQPTPQPTRRPRGSSAYLERNGIIGPPYIQHEEWSKANLRLRPGKTVELKNGDFIFIRHIIQNLEDDEIRIRGYLFRRHKRLMGMFRRKINELCWCLDVDADDPRPPEMQSMVEEPLEAILRLRRLKLTNTEYPELHNYGLHSSVPESTNEGLLLARWKYTRIYDNASERKKGGKVIEHVIERLKEGTVMGIERITTEFVEDYELRNRFTGGIVHGGAYCPGERRPSGAVIRGMTDSLGISPFGDLELSEISGSEFDRRSSTTTTRNPHSVSDITPGVSELRITSNPDSPQRKYTYGDCFCGVGGATRGAVMAGLEPLWGFDFDRNAGEAWHANFPQATLYEMHVAEFITRAKNNDAFRVDVLHLSPPCQFFSPAHTINGPNDDMNSATMFSIGHILDAAKPRVVTLEQTYGLCSKRFLGFFYSLISFFTERNFSIRWKICHLQNWGLPQRRCRLIMIASCIGEVLPEFPPFTHSQYPSDGLRPFNSVNDVLRTVSNPRTERGLRQSSFIPRIPWNGDSIAPRCITTSGGQNYHPSGLRNFTYEEYAALQGFPPNHKFGESRMLRQVGNAWAPSVAQVLFKAVIEALEKADGVTRSRRSGSTAENAVLIA